MGKVAISSRPGSSHSGNVFTLPPSTAAHGQVELCVGTCVAVDAQIEGVSGATKLSCPSDVPGIAQAKYVAFSRFGHDLHQEASEFLRQQIDSLNGMASDLPADIEGLSQWMAAQHDAATCAYQKYLQERNAGGKRRYFSNRAHALHFLGAVAPSKLVDGAWLFGLVRLWKDPRFYHLIKTYVEELGAGDPGKNHVALFRELLQSHGIQLHNQLPDRFYLQGAVQLALAHASETYIPEVIGFNLGFEQLPLHLLVTAYELNELGIDPYYFTLHITIDNADTGHAFRAVEAVLDATPKLSGADEFWQRVRTGHALNAVGAGTNAIIDSYSIADEVIAIFKKKSVTGRGAHSDYCLIAGRTVNDWLSRPEDTVTFLSALQSTGWIKLGKPVKESRFWGLLCGPRAEMFGVFNDYELQTIHDWIRGELSADGRQFDNSDDEESEAHLTSALRPSFRAQLRSRRIRPANAAQDERFALDPDLDALELAIADNAGGQLENLAPVLLAAMAPSTHWTPVGLRATREFVQWID